MKFGTEKLLVMWTTQHVSTFTCLDNVSEKSPKMTDFTHSSSSSRMRVMNRNWSATKQRLHPQSAAETSHHSVLSGDRIRQCGTSSGSRHKNTDQRL